MRKLLFLFVSALLPWLSVRSQKPVYKDAGQPVETRVKDLLNRMTLHEKVLQLNQYTFGENVWGIERSGFFNGQGKWAKGFENQMV